MTLDTMSDLTRDIMDLADNDITDKVRLHLFQALMVDHIYTCEGLCLFVEHQSSAFNCGFGKPFQGAPP